MADGVLFGGVHLGEGLVRAFRLEDGVVAVAAVAARREDQLTASMLKATATSAATSSCGMR